MLHRRGRRPTKGPRQTAAWKIPWKVEMLWRGRWHLDVAPPWRDATRCNQMQLSSDLSALSQVRVQDHDFCQRQV